MLAALLFMIRKHYRNPTIRMDESRNLTDFRMKFQNSPPLLFCDSLKCEWVGGKGERKKPLNVLGSPVPLPQSVLVGLLVDSRSKKLQN